MAKWDKNCDPAAITRRIERERKESGQPTVHIPGAFPNELHLILDGMLRFSSKIPEHERALLINKAVAAAASKGEITSTRLLQCCNVLEAEYLHKPTVVFRLLTGLSLFSVNLLSPLKIASTTITFKPSASLGTGSRKQLHQQNRRAVGFDLPETYMDVAVTVRARTPFEAVEKALSAIDLARATWNFAINRNNHWRTSSGRRRPVNEILLSPFHTIHRKDGTLATEAWWYDAGYTGPERLFSDQRRLERVLAFSRTIRSRIKRSTYANELEDAFIRYVRALDSPDLNDSFLRLWSLLEFLTDSAADPRKLAIRRAAFMFGDDGHSAIALAHLARYRNRYVHAASDSVEIEALVYMLKRYVEALLVFHIGRSFRFESRSVAAQFMDMPTSKDEIARRIKQLRNAHKFLVT